MTPRRAVVVLLLALPLVACDSKVPSYQGWVEADLIFVAPDEVGRVKTLSVREGDHVTTGEALFSADDPTKLLERSDKPVLKPEMPFEKTGQYTAGTTFAEGLVFFQGKWFLYYGAADSMAAVAMAPAAN